MNKTIKDFTEIELKAMVYDEMVKVEIAQNNIKLINQELASRGQEQVTGTNEVATTTEDDVESIKE